MTLGIRRRRAERHRRWRFLKTVLLIALTVGLGVLLYETGAEISNSRIASLEAEVERLSARERDFGERNARLRVEVEKLRGMLTREQSRYEADVPTGKAREILDLAGQQMDQGVAAERIEFMIAAAGQKLDCAGQTTTRRFLVRTPIYQGANDAVTFADNAITVTAVGTSVADASGNPEAWFDPAQPVLVRFVGLGGETAETTGLLPLHHSLIRNGAEYRFSIVAAEQRGFIKVSSDRCAFPG